MFEGYRLSTVDTAQASIRVRHGGSGPPLLLLHGSPQTHVMWHLLAPRLAEDVMGPAARGTYVRFRVLIDGRPPGAAHGIDVEEQGNGSVTEQRLYQLIRQPKPIVDRHFEIEFLDAGVEAFAFTFG